MTSPSACRRRADRPACRGSNRHRCSAHPATLPRLTSGHAAEDGAEQVGQPTTGTGLLAGTAPHPLGEVGQHDRRQDRQQLLDQVAVVAEVAAERLGYGSGVVAEHVADDLLPVTGVDLVEVHPAFDQLRRVVVQRPGQGRLAVRVSRVGLHPAHQGRQRLADRGLGRRVVDAQLAGQGADRDVRHDVVDRAHRRALRLVGARRPRPSIADYSAVTGREPPGSRPRPQGCPHTCAAVGPAAGCRSRSSDARLGQGREHDDHRGQLRRRGVAGDDLEDRGTVRTDVVRRLDRGHTVCRSHSGMFPCFLGGSVSRLVRSSRSTRVISTRVSCGMITAST